MNNLSLHELIRNEFILKIAENKLHAGQHIADVKIYAVEHKYNYNLVAQVFRDLDSEGITYFIEGQGRYITKDQNILDNIIITSAQNITRDYISKLQELNYNNEMITALLEEVLCQS